MDSPLPENRSNLLIYAIGIAVVISLVLGIVNLVKIQAVSKQTQLAADLLARVETMESSVKTAAADASSVKTRITGLSTETQRAFDSVRDEILNIRSSLSKVTSDTKANSDRLDAMGSRAPSSSTASSSGAASGGAAPGTTTPDGGYVVKAGDTFARIAAQFGVTVEDITRANPGVDPRRLQIGQRIVIPSN